MALDLHHKSINDEDEDHDSPFVIASNLCLSQIQNAALNTAIELNLLEIIASSSKGGGHVSAAEVASQLPSSMQHKDLAYRIDRILRLLASQSVLTCNIRVVTNNNDNVTERVYTISPVGKLFLINHDKDAHGLLPLFLYASHPALSKAWVNLKKAVIEEDTDLFNKVHGMPMFKYSKVDPTWNNLFNKVMASLSDLEIRRILEIYKGFEGISTLVDVGGGTGQILKMIISKYPSIKGINFDLPQVIQNAKPNSGIEHVGGDMFESIPKGDAIILKSVCHNWSDENCIKLLKKCYEALAEKGKVIVIELIMPEVIEASEEAKYVAGLDNVMFLHDGGERTQTEYESLSKRSGFSTFKLASLAFNVQGVMEFHK